MLYLKTHYLPTFYFLLLHTKESTDFFMQAQLQRHPKLLLKATYFFHELSETTQAAYLEVNNN